MIAPRDGFFPAEGKWAVENEGIPPDIDIGNWPKEVIAGHAPQLERAVEEGLWLLKSIRFNASLTSRRLPRGGNAGCHSVLNRRQSTSGGGCVLKTVC
jgi:hypothetical protein